MARASFSIHQAAHLLRGASTEDHDENGRLIEDYWEAEWPKVEEDFREMKQLGANVVRVHLQFGRFMVSESQPNTNALARFAKLLFVAERTGLYLNVTGLGCYHKQDVPAWYDELNEEERWSAQANFWRAVARVGRGSPAIFCYDLMNEPVAPHSNGVGKDWLGPPFAGKHFVQWISREGRGRERPEIARAWIRHLAAAIRAEDSSPLITVGLVDWSLPRPELDSAFHPEVVAPELDFLSVHIYPEKGKVTEAIETLKLFNIGKPVVIEETFPLKCSREEFDEFFQRSKTHANGWIGFYWGRARLMNAAARRNLRTPSCSAGLNGFKMPGRNRSAVRFPKRNHALPPVCRLRRDVVVSGARFT